MAQSGGDGTVEVVVEIPRGSRNKYEQTDDGVIWFARRLGGPVGFPGGYGYVVGYQGEDGDALDAAVLLDEPTFPEVHIRCRELGSYLFEVYRMLEEKTVTVLEHRHRERTLGLMQDMGG